MEMRFLDSSVFPHAYLKPRRKLKPIEEKVKVKAKEIIKRVNSDEEEVSMTVVHLSEVVNIIESHIGLLESISFLAKIFSLKNVVVDDVSREEYIEALAISRKHYVSINDALAYVKMKENGIDEIYSFNKHFKNIPGIKILPKI